MGAYTDIDDPSAHFQATAYTGNGDSSDDTNAITNGGNSDLKPDLTWFKRRDYDNQHLLFDSTRGVTKYITTDRVDAEGTIADRLVSFDTNGFTVKSSSGAINQHDEPFICWQWKANGGTTSTNTDGSTNTTVQWWQRNLRTWSGRKARCRTCKEQKWCWYLDIYNRCF